MRQSSLHTTTVGSNVGSDGGSILLFDNSEKFENLSKTESALELAYRLNTTRGLISNST